MALDKGGRIINGLLMARNETLLILVMALLLLLLLLLEIFNKLLVSLLDSFVLLLFEDGEEKLSSNC